jgi:hypothetical protein
MDRSFPQGKKPKSQKTSIAKYMQKHLYKCNIVWYDVKN